MSIYKKLKTFIDIILKHKTNQSYKMKTRFQTKVVQSDTMTTQSPNPVTAPLEEDESELCSICFEPMASQNSVTIHKGEEWHHSLHIDCRNKWVNTCKQNNTHATCPLCPSFKIMEQSIYIKRTLAHFETIKRHNGNLPFIGIMIYMGGSCVLKLTNLDFCDEKTNMPFTPNTPLSVIYKAAFDMGPNVYQEMGICSTKNLSHNINPLNWLNWKYPKLKLKNTYFAVPPIGLATNISKYIQTSRTIGEIYIEYIASIYAINDINIWDDNACVNIKNICNRITQTNAGGDTHTEGYENPENPHFPQYYRAFTERPQSTNVPMAWIAIDADYE
jgi:hypothetical protein